MKDVKTKLIRTGVNIYTKHEATENPVFCAEAIGYFKACKIIMPEHANEFDNIINAYLELFRLLVLKIIQMKQIL